MNIYLYPVLYSLTLRAYIPLNKSSFSYTANFIHITIKILNTKLFKFVKYAITSDKIIKHKSINARMSAFIIVKHKQRWIYDGAFVDVASSSQLGVINITISVIPKLLSLDNKSSQNQRTTAQCVSNHWLK